MKNRKPSSGSPSDDDFEGTRIDLGEDLLHEASSPTLTRPAPAEESVDSLFATAKILLGEGMLEQAKKTLHSILIRDAHYSPASLLLKEIHERELQQIFSGTRSRRVFHRDSDRDAELFDVDRDQLLRKLDEDLGLKLEPSLLRESDIPNPMRSFQLNLEKQLRGASAQDRIDLGIGFLEMGLHDLAAVQFQGALATWTREADPRLVAAACLLALTQILEGRPFDATMTLQPVSNNSEIPVEDKLELFYLMGRAHENLRNREFAMDWYRKAEAIDPQYRDLTERLEALGT